MQVINLLLCYLKSNKGLSYLMLYNGVKCLSCMPRSVHVGWGRTWCQVATAQTLASYDVTKMGALISQLFGLHFCTIRKWQCSTRLYIHHWCKLGQWNKSSPAQMAWGVFSDKPFLLSAEHWCQVRPTFLWSVCLLCDPLLAGISGDFLKLYL